MHCEMFKSTELYEIQKLYSMKMLSHESKAMKKELSLKYVPLV